MREFVYLIIFSNSDDDHQHLGFGLYKLINDADTLSTQLDFQEIGKIKTALVAKGFPIPAFILRQRIFLNFLDSLFYQHLLTPGKVIKVFI